MTDESTGRTGWFKSSHSNPSQDCVEVRFDSDRVQVRDSKEHGNGPILHLDPRDWASFLSAINRLQ